MKNENELNDVFQRLMNGAPKDEQHYAPLNGVDCNSDLYRLFNSMDQEAAVACRKIMAQIDKEKPQRPINPEVWLKTADVMSCCQISRRTVANYRDQKKLAFTKIGNKCLYREYDVVAMMFYKYNGKKVETGGKQAGESK
ncbi:MAG TPA: helix-turn-helix domain-containing protein [Bacteroidales bacterium]|nr:helix-turn-helix domain-containing protein [Bacteroidales bacterium]